MGESKAVAEEAHEVKNKASRHKKRGSRSIESNENGGNQKVFLNEMEEKVSNLKQEETKMMMMQVTSHLLSILNWNCDGSFVSAPTRKKHTV